MKIMSCRLRIIQIPFVMVFKHALKSRSEVESLIVEVHTESGIVGYGEAIPREYVTGESIASVRDNLLNHVFPTAKGLEFKTCEEVTGWFEEFHSTFSTLGEKELCVKTAFELAVLDAFGKEKGESILNILGGPRISHVVYSGIVSAGRPFVVKRILKLCKKYRLTQVKLKVGLDLSRDLKNLKAARKILGPEASLRVDANEAWTLSEAQEALEKFLEFGVVSVEQPLPAQHRDEYPELKKALGGRMLICLDESLCSLQDAEWMIQHNGADVFNLRVSKNGGIVNSLKLYNIAKDAGLHCQLGAQVGETSLLSSAGRILAALTGDLVFHEGSAGTRLLKQDITRTPLEFGSGGAAAIDEIQHHPGLGVLVDPQLLKKITRTVVDA